MLSPNYQASIMVVDDDAMVRDVIISYLKEMGMVNIVEAKNPAEGLKKIHDKSFPIDLILCDWEMPVVNGLTLLQAVRKSPHRKRTKFIMVTSQRSMERYKISRAARWNVDSYIVKPFRQNLLKEKIWEVMHWKDEMEKKASHG